MTNLITGILGIAVGSFLGYTKGTNKAINSMTKYFVSLGYLRKESLDISRKIIKNELEE